MDPLESKYAGMSPYNYSFNNPVMFNDPSGMEGEEIPKTYNDKPVHYTQDAEGNSWAWGYNNKNGMYDIALGGVAGTPLAEVEIKDSESEYWYFYVPQLSEDGKNIELQHFATLDGSAHTSFGDFKTGIGSGTAILGTDKHWHKVPGEWLEKSLSLAGDNGKVLNMINSWKKADYHYSILITEIGRQRIGKTVQAGLALSSILSRKGDIDDVLELVSNLQTSDNDKIDDKIELAKNITLESPKKREFKKPVPGLSGKEGAKDVPDWARGEKPYTGESGDQFARRLLDEKYGKGNYKTKSQTEYSKIKKWGDRNFK